MSNKFATTILLLLLTLLFLQYSCVAAGGPIPVSRLVVNSVNAAEQGIAVVGTGNPARTGLFKVKVCSDKSKSVEIKSYTLNYLEDGEHMLTTGGEADKDVNPRYSGVVFYAHPNIISKLKLVLFVEKNHISVRRDVDLASFAETFTLDYEGDISTCHEIMGSE